MSRRTVRATPQDDGQRADVVLGRRLDGVSRRSARQLGLRGRLFIDGHPRAPSTRVTTGQDVALQWPDEAPAPHLDLLALTPRIVYVAKPCGVHTHRLRPDDPPSVADSVVARFPECASASEHAREMGALHRLDAPTSGVLAFARDRETWRAGRAAFDARAVDKLYLAVSQAGPRAPWPPRGLGLAPPAPDASPTLGAGVRVDLPLGDGSAGQVIARPDGRAAHTDVWAIALQREATCTRGIFLLRLHSGHRHQARAHLATVGWPICGDPRYPAPGPALPSPRLLLHALSLDLSGALPGERRVICPWPIAFRTAWARMRHSPRRRVDRFAGG
jgi:23S rRNA pseudouridine1911/1915/1917 synthase